jgi:acyl-homoserine lactone acylase PvdQ
LLCLTTATFGAEKIEIYRDTFGVPHVYAKTMAGAAYAAGYAQAEDRLDEMMKNYRKAEGTMSEAFGPEWFRHDYRQRLWRHAIVARLAYNKISPDARAMCEGFAAGVKQYMKEHPEKVPAHAVPMEPWRLLALGRYIIWGWPEGEAGADLQRGGIQPDPVAYRGSNQMLVSAKRSANKAPMAVIDPHLSWYGEFRFYEIRMYGGDFAISGAAILGLPFPTLGHTRFVSVAMTTGGPDTSDVFVEEIKDGKYKFNNEWRPVVTRNEVIRVKTANGIDEKNVTIEETHHGPVVAHKDGKAYTFAIPYMNEAGLLDQSLKMMRSRNLTEIKAALSGLQLMAQNIMVGTVQGDIFYVRNGRVPKRAPGCDWTKPMPGTGECEWQGIHDFADLAKIENPPQGYMQNNNCPPEFITKGSPITPEAYKDRLYLYNDPRRENHQRAAMTLQELSSDDNVTEQEMLGYAFSTGVYHSELWQERIRKASATGAAADAIAGWNRRADADSRGALAYYFFKMALGGANARALEPPANLTDDQVRAALSKADADLSRLGANATYGTYFRVGREGANRTWPVGGGVIAEAGMQMPRAINFRKQGDIMLGQGGQTSTQIVFLKKKPESFMIIPLGESDDPKSPHFDDQAEKLFSKAIAKPTYFDRKNEVKKIATSTKVVTFEAVPLGAAAATGSK